MRKLALLAAVVCVLLSPGALLAQNSPMTIEQRRMDRVRALYAAIGTDVFQSATIDALFNSGVSGRLSPIGTANGLTEVKSLFYWDGVVPPDTRQLSTSCRSFPRTIVSGSRWISKPKR